MDWIFDQKVNLIVFSNPHVINSLFFCHSSNVGLVYFTHTHTCVFQHISHALYIDANNFSINTIGGDHWKKASTKRPRREVPSVMNLTKEPWEMPCLGGDLVQLIGWKVKLKR